MGGRSQKRPVLGARGLALDTVGDDHRPPPAEAMSGVLADRPHLQVGGKARPAPSQQSRLLYLVEEPTSGARLESPVSRFVLVEPGGRGAAEDPRTARPEHIGAEGPSRTGQLRGQRRAPSEIVATGNDVVEGPGPPEWVLRKAEATLHVRAAPTDARAARFMARNQS